MCCRTLSKLWDIESPKHASFLCFAPGDRRKKKKPLPVRFTLISAWNQTRERMEAEDRVVFIVAEVALAHTWPFVAASAAATGDVYVASLVCVCVCVCDLDLSPGAFMDVFIEGFHWSSPRCLLSPPQRAPAVYLESASASGESGGPFEACWLTLLFCCLGRFFFFFC